MRKKGKQNLTVYKVPAKVYNELKETQSLKNSLSNIFLTANPYDTVPLSQRDTLYVNTSYSLLTIQRIILNYLFVNHGIIQTCIEQPVQDALRGGFEINSKELDEDDINEIQNFIEENNVLDMLLETMTWVRLFGGGGIIINCEEDPSEPFNIENVKYSKKLKFYSADRWELSAKNRNSESFNFYGIDIHTSRILKINNKQAPSIVRPQLAGWGMSELERMVRDLNSYFKNKTIAFELLDESKIDVYKVKNLSKTLITSQGQNQVQSRFETANQIKNTINAIVIDSEDDYQQKTQTFAGISDMIKENRIGIATALKMPMTKLFGISASGFNAGEDDIENYNAMIESEIRSRLRYPVKILINIICLKLFGYIPDFSFDFKNLRIMNEAEEEQVNTARSNRVLQLYDRGLITSKEVGQILGSYKLLPTETEMGKGNIDDFPIPPIPTQQRQVENNNE